MTTEKEKHGIAKPYFPEVTKLYMSATKGEDRQLTDRYIGYLLGIDGVYPEEIKYVSSNVAIVLVSYNDIYDVEDFIYHTSEVNPKQIFKHGKFTDLDSGGVKWFSHTCMNNFIGLINGGKYTVRIDSDSRRMRTLFYQSGLKAVEEQKADVTFDYDEYDMTFYIKKGVHNERIWLFTWIIGEKESFTDLVEDIEKE
jgi:hypothetical protein